MAGRTQDPTPSADAGITPKIFDVWCNLSSAVLLCLYLVTLCPTIYSGDAPELATAATTFGVAHAPGYPLYSLLGNLWTRLLPFGDPGWRLNLFSALCAIAATRLLYGSVKRLGGGRLGASFAALSLGVGSTFWSQALISEVYAFDILLAAATVYTALRCSAANTSTSLRLAVFCAAAWISHRNVNALFVLTLLPLVWPVLRKSLGAPRQLAALLLVLLLPLLSWLYLPICASADPLLNIGDPSSLARFQAVITARIYQHLLFAGDFFAQSATLLGTLPRGLGLALLLAPVGLVLWWRRSAAVSTARRGLLALLGLLLANFLFAANYAVADAMVFLLPLSLALATLAGLGMHALGAALPQRLAWLPVGAALVGIAGLGSWNYRSNDLAGQTLARDFARDALSYPLADGIVLSHVDSVTFALWYGQAVESRGPARLLVVSRGLALDWHQQWARRRRPDLEVPSYLGTDTPSHWPALLALANVTRVPVFVTANLDGYFQPSDRVALRQRVRERPAGLFTELQDLSQPAAPAATITRNREFWQRSWRHVTTARGQHLSEDMTALLLHYASMRVLFARYCLLHNDPNAAITAATAVIELQPDPLIARLNQSYQRRGTRYHMSDMRQQARRLARQARQLSSGAVSLEQLRSQPAPHQLAAVMQAGQAALNTGQLAAALARFDAVLLVRPRHLDALLQRGKVLAHLGDQPGAAAAFEKLLAQTPQSAEAWLGLAQALLKSDRPAALRALRKAAQTPQGTPGRGTAIARLRALGGG